MSFLQGWKQVPALGRIREKTQELLSFNCIGNCQLCWLSFKNKIFSFFDTIIKYLSMMGWFKLAGSYGFAVIIDPQKG